MCGPHGLPAPRLALLMRGSYATRGPRGLPPMRGPRGLPPHPRPPALVLAGRPPTTSPPSAGPAWTPRGSCGIHGLRAPRLVRAPRSPPLCRGLCGLRPPAPAPAACGPLAARGPMRRPRSLRAPRLAPMRGPRGLPPPHLRRRSSRRGRRFRATCVRGLHLWLLLGEGVKQMFHVKHTPTRYPPRCFPPERLHRASTSPHGPHGSHRSRGSHRPRPPPAARVACPWVALRFFGLRCKFSRFCTRPSRLSTLFSCGQQGKGQVANASQAFAEAQPLCGECKTVRICSAAAFFSRFCPVLAASHAG